MSKLKTILIQGKPYVTVAERLKAFREEFEEYTLETELVSVDNVSALIRAVIKDPSGRIIATGTAFERADNKRSMVNATSHVENCETSAWGRALGNFGIGIDHSVATADEVQNAARKPAYEPKPAPKVEPVKPKKPDTALVMENINLCKSAKQVQVMWDKAMKHDWTPAEKADLEECRANMLKKIEDERKEDVAAQAAQLLGVAPAKDGENLLDS